jgi:DNA polymerase delta subunit 1
LALNNPQHPLSQTKNQKQGIETVRRDNCGLVRQVVATCLDRILIDRCACLG